MDVSFLGPGLFSFASIKGVDSLRQEVDRTCRPPPEPEKYFPKV